MFSQQLTQDAQPILKAIQNHPFIKGMGMGKVDKAALIAYVEQDYQYLSTFIKVYARTMAHLKTREQMRYFHERIAFILNNEVIPHQLFCQIAGVKYEDLQHAIPSPKATLYQYHMYQAVQSGHLANIICALLPCPWTYQAIAKHMWEAGLATDQNPFKEWIEFYYPSDHDEDLIQPLFDMLDQVATEMSPAERRVARHYFLKSCELEWEFWEQAYYQQTWRFIDLMKKGD